MNFYGQAITRQEDWSCFSSGNFKSEILGKTADQTINYRDGYT